MDQHWYVVRSKPGKESFAANNLIQQGFNCFCPFYVCESAGLKKRKLVRPYFPGYMFICLDLLQECWEKVYSTRGVAGMVGCARGQISRLPAGYVEELMKLSNGGFMNVASADEVSNRYSAGDKLKVVTGPMSGMTGEVVRCSKDRVLLLFSLLGRKNRVNIPLSIVEAC